MVKHTIFVLLFAVAFSSQLLAEETPKAEVVKVDVKSAGREVHPLTGSPIYRADETIPVGISAHIREKDGTFRGEGSVSLCSSGSSGSCGSARVTTTFYSSCSFGSCQSSFRSPTRAGKPTQ